MLCSQKLSGKPPSEVSAPCVQGPQPVAPLWGAPLRRVRGRWKDH